MKGVTGRLLNGADAVLADQSASSRTERLEHLQRALQRVFHAVLVTEPALQGRDGSISPQAVKRLERLAARRVMVFLLSVANQYPSQLPHFRVVRPATPNDLKDAITGAGYRLSSTLAIVGGEPASLSLVYQVWHSNGAFGDRVPPFLATSTRRSIPASEVLLPIAKSRVTLTGDGALQALFREIKLAERVNVSETASIIKSGDILSRYKDIDRQAEQNLARAERLMLSQNAALGGARTSLLDPRSGAVFLEPEDWRLARSSLSPQGVELYDYFNENLPHYWQPDHPSKRRVLYMPTKVLLRGEEYYTNMRNTSPLVRVDRMGKELVRCAQLENAALASLGVGTGLTWRLALAFLDQIRSIALQFLSFVHAGKATFDGGQTAALLDRLVGDRATGAHGLALASVRAYYACLLNRLADAQTYLREANARWQALSANFGAAVKSAMDEVARDPQGHILGGLVRRWREADHPGENLMTALLASEAFRTSATIVAAGIGWGGIELPLVFDFATSLLPKSVNTRVLIIRWSHYRDPGANVTWHGFPDPVPTPDVDGSTVALFDDNTLTGVTLQKIRDELLLKGARRIGIYVTRYSGERRWHQMQMRDHGAVDPDFLLRRVGGYLGQTPFARSWSKKVYANPIGVFSLSRRRILEAIYNNSTVELYDREGF